MAKADIIDGKAFAADLRGRIGQAAAEVRERHGLTPGLAVVLVGADPASEIYVRNKGKATVAAGMGSFEHRLPAEADQAVLLELVARLHAPPKEHGRPACRARG